MPGEERVFGPVFEAAAAERITFDIDGRTEDDRDLLLDAFLTHRFADFTDERRIPGTGQSGGGREAGRRHGIAKSHLLLLGGPRLAQAVRAVGNHVTGDAALVDALHVP